MSPKMEQATDQPALVAALLDPAVYNHPVEHVQKLETHISYVFLAGDYVYKIKKAVDLGFLDFRNLDARRFYCQEELRLNRRLAPALYLGVVAVAGPAQRPVLGAQGEAIEYAVKMQRFPQEQLLDRLLADGRLTARHIDELAAKTAAFHATAAVASPADPYGTPEAIERPARDNFAQLRAVSRGLPEPQTLALLEAWTAARAGALRPVFEARKRAAFVRECHGDFHLGNIALVDGEVTPFDCLEFDPNLRWIDVMNEVAFLVMDLEHRGRAGLARRFPNRYLELTGDYEGLGVLGFYVAYRAVVRAKIHWLRANQPEVDAAEKRRLEAQTLDYLKLARAQAVPECPAILITHGVSGSGKTTATQSLVETIGAMRVRSDIERKRLQGLAALARTGSGIGQGAYTQDAGARTYGRLEALARAVVEAGFPVIVDATFLARAQRDAFHRLAGALRVPFLILEFSAPEAELRARVRARMRRGNDASEADVEVLAHQLRAREPLQPDERAVSVTCSPGDDSDYIPAWNAVRERLAAGPNGTGGTRGVSG